MPPKRKVVKKTVRAPKSKAKPQAETPAPPSPEPQPSQPPPAEETLAAEPASGASAEPQSEETTAAAAVETPEPFEEEPFEEPAAVETPRPFEEPAAVEDAETEAPPAAEEPPSKSGKKPKTTRVVKKIVKKIVKKVVPKTAVKEKHKEDGTKTVAVVEDEPKEEAQKAEVEAAADQEASGEQQETENPKVDEAPTAMDTEHGKAVVDAEVDEKVDDEEKDEELLEEEEKGEDLEEVPMEKEAATSERERSTRRKTEIFIGGLDRDAKEEDLRKVFGQVGEIVEVRMIMDGKTGKNKGYAFLRYAEASQAKKAVAQFEKVEVCGKRCGASALYNNDTIFLGNIDRKWKQEDIIKLLQDNGIDKIEAVTVMPDPNNADINRGFAFLELETNKDAQSAYKKLQKKDAFGEGRSIKVAWAEPLNDPDEEEMKKVKSVYAEGIPDSWDEGKIKEVFKKFGDIERVVLARNITSAKRKDFAFVNYATREAALSCIESFNEEELTDNGSKVNVKVSLAKPVNKQSKGGPKSGNKDIVKKTPKVYQRGTKANLPSSKGKYSRSVYPTSGHTTSSTNHELLHVLRHQATWKEGQVGYARGPAVIDHIQGVEGKRPYGSLGDGGLYSDMRGYPRPRLDNFPPTGPSYGAMPHIIGGQPHPYYQHQSAVYPAGAHYGTSHYSAPHQMRPGPPPPYGSYHYPRY